ncbi:hypothetical protein J0X14_17200 [Muricauda sp. CAU 1633]|uniref:hypothetical protein n=1 Tax=Allomuricauda sp. CAU 1633 TaxID=2816036 RepID=UPI001A8D7665|nr:hypothetical protein [Muricauda sp. CAU 1633]MBO0324049.1 hypothetical protein [Muricauda sp. CAU 1633]
MTIGIKEESGKTIGYEIDGEIINGLYQTIELDKIKENCQKFEINVEIPTDGKVATHISKQGNLCIVTCVFDTKNQVQFLIGNDMSIEEFQNESIPGDFKKLITQAYELIN